LSGRVREFEKQLKNAKKTFRKRQKDLKNTRELIGKLKEASGF
jgi:hypothetical protein